MDRETDFLQSYRHLKGCMKNGDREAYYQIKGLRTKVYRNTIDLVTQGHYTTEDGKRVELGDGAEMMNATVYYDHEIETDAPTADETCIEVVNDDCLAVAMRLKADGYTPAVLNMANRHHPGGGVDNGAAAQEETLFRRTDIYRSLYRFSPLAKVYGLPPSSHHYPLEVPILALLLSFATHYIGDDARYSFFANSNLPTYLFMCVVVAIFVGLNTAAEEMFKDRKLLVREQFLNLSRSSYLNAKIINLFALATLQTAMLVCIGHSIMGIPLSHWPAHAAVLLTTFAFAILFGLNISSGLKNAVSIYISIPLVIVPQLLFSGTMVNFDRLHPTLANREYTPVIGDIMVSRWAYEALAVDQYVNGDYEKRFFSLINFSACL